MHCYCVQEDVTSALVNKWTSKALHRNQLLECEYTGCESLAHRMHARSIFPLLTYKSQAKKMDQLLFHSRMFNPWFEFVSLSLSLSLSLSIGVDLTKRKNLLRLTGHSIGQMVWWNNVNTVPLVSPFALALLFGGFICSHLGLLVTSIYARQGKKYTSEVSGFICGGWKINQWQGQRKPPGPDASLARWMATAGSFFPFFVLFTRPLLRKSRPLKWLPEASDQWLSFCGQLTICIALDH